MIADLRDVIRLSYRGGDLVVERANSGSKQTSFCQRGGKTMDSLH